MRLTYHQPIVIKFGIEFMRQPGSATGGLNSRSMGRPFILLIIGCIVLGFLAGGACANAGISQPAGNLEGKSGETAAAPGLTPPVSPQPPAEPLPPPSLPATPVQADQAPAQPLPNSVPPPVNSLDATTLITKQASQLTLTMDDMGLGWTRGNAVAPAIPLVTSSSHVYYMQGSSYAPGVQNTVAVFRNIAAAENAYAKEKQLNLIASNPGIGDECLLNDSVPINKLLVFRKNNVVVWLWLKLYKEGNIERYARMLEQKLTNSAPLPASPGLPSQQASTPPPQAPLEPSAGLQPAVAKPADGLVTKQAYQMVLTIEDMGPGWIKGNVSPPANSKSLSSSQVSYSQGSNFAPTVQNTVVVYRDVQAAVNAYASVKPAGVSLLYPAIGNECFQNDSVSINRLLVFRKGNVLVWIWLQQYKKGDIEGYARTVEKKVTP